MIRLILTVILCVLTAALAVFLTLNPGTVNVSFLGVEAQAPFALAAGVLLLVTFVLVLAWWVIAKVWGAPDSWRKMRGRRRREQGFDALERALIASAAGQGQLAVRQASRAEALLDRPALSRLLAARAAEAAGDLESAHVNYDAMLDDPKTRLVAQRGLASLAEARGDDQLVLTHAGAAFDQGGQARWAFEALFAAQLRTAHWDKAEKSLSEGERRGHVPPAVAKRMRAVLLTAQAKQIESSDPEEAARLAERAADASPGFAPAAELAGRLMAEHRKHRRAAEILEAAWRQAPHPALTRAYAGLRRSDTKTKRAERLRHLASLNADHRESRLLLAETALEQSNLEAAQAALGPLTAQPPVSARVCALAARLAQLDGDEPGARRWMARAAHAPGEADWSDINETGSAFDYTNSDWMRLVDAWGREARLIHPRHERFEIAAAAAPDSVLIAGPARPAPGEGDKPAAAFYEPLHAPDDPGVDEGDDTRN
jgi:HemY protein